MSSEIQAPPAPRWLSRGSQHFRAEGPRALERLSVDAEVSADPPESFRLDVIRADLGEVMVERVRATSFRLMGIDGPPHDAPTLSVCFVGRGRLRFSRPTESVLETRDCWAALGGHDIAFAASEPVEVLRAATPAVRFSRQTLEACGLPRITAGRTAVSDGLFGLLRAVVDSPPATTQQEHDGGAHIARAVNELIAATVDDLAADELLEGDDALDRLRALEYIEQHLADPATTPDAVAAALRIGRRRLYRLFEDDEMSIAARIRQRRLDGVAAVLVASPSPPSVRGLAARFGFSSTDALTRNFRDRFGMTVRGYHDHLHRDER